MDRFTKLLTAKDIVVTAWLSQRDPFYLSMLAKTDFDCLTLDMQHGMQTEDSVINGIAAIAPSGKPAIVRIPVGRFDLISKVLDAGAHGMIAPMINTVEDAKQLVSFAKYVPNGDRSFGPSQALNVLNVGMEEYVKAANKHTVIFAMIETKQAVENIEAIADVDGIDGLFCGPGDLSISVRGNNIPDAYGKDTLHIVEKIATTAHERGKLAGSWCGTVEQMELVKKMGFDFASLGGDEAYVNLGANSMLSQLSFR